jgi:hypothetical protein
MVTKDYNIVKWEDYFYLDETSPSGLRWKVDRMSGKTRDNAIVSAGDVAGCLRKHKTGRPLCWCVGLEGVYYCIHRIIYILIKGSIDIDLVIDHLNGDASDNTHSNLVLKSPRANSQNREMSSNNTSGVIGVYLTTTYSGSTSYRSWVAYWNDTVQKRLSKSFSVKKFGYDAAFALAVAYRTKQIELLNEAGQSYTERHLR